MVGIFFVGSEYGLFQQLTLATTSDSPELVYDTYPFKEDIDLDMQCICVTGQVYSNCISDNLCCYGHSRWDFSLNYEYLYKIDFEVDEKDNKLSVITGRDDVYSDGYHGHHSPQTATAYHAPTRSSYPYDDACPSHIQTHYC